MKSAEVLDFSSSYHFWNFCTASHFLPFMERVPCLLCYYCLSSLFRSLLPEGMVPGSMVLVPCPVSVHKAAHGLWRTECYVSSLPSRSESLGCLEGCCSMQMAIYVVQIMLGIKKGILGRELREKPTLALRTLVCFSLAV